MDEEDKKIIEGILKKDKFALTKLVNKYGSTIHNVVRSILKEDYESEGIDECIDDILICLWKNIDCFSEEKGNFKWWLIAVAKNRALSYKKSFKKSLNNVDIDEVKIASKDSVEAMYLNIEGKKEMEEILNSLEPKDREIFIRRYFRDEKISEISKAMNMSSISIYNRLSRGRKKLKKIIRSRNL